MILPASRAPRISDQHPCPKTPESPALSEIDFRIRYSESLSPISDDYREASRPTDRHLSEVYLLRDWKLAAICSPISGRGVTGAPTRSLRDHQKVGVSTEGHRKPPLSNDVLELKRSSPAMSPTPSGAASNFEIGEGGRSLRCPAFALIGERAGFLDPIQFPMERLGFDRPSGPSPGGRDRRRGAVARSAAQCIRRQGLEWRSSASRQSSKDY